MRIGALALLAALAGGTDSWGQRGARGWRPDERVVLADFGWVEAVAASRTAVFAATRGGLTVFDRRFERWEPPVTPLDGYPVQRVHAALADPIDGSVWIAGDAGVVHYRPVLDYLEVVGVPGGVRDLMLDQRDPGGGVYLSDGRQWMFLARGALIPTPAFEVPAPGRRVAAQRLRVVIGSVPFAETLSANVLTDDRLRTYQYTSAATVAETEDVYFGTNGLGLIQVDPLTTRFERHPFGLLADAVSAVVAGPDGVWVGTGGRSYRVGFTHVTEDLQDFEYEEGGRIAGFRFRQVVDLVLIDDVLWAATDAGVVLVERGSAGRVLGTREGLPDRQATRLAPSPYGVWVGTLRGLALVDGEGAVQQVDGGRGAPVLALAAAGDTVWVGTDAGLGVATARSMTLIVPSKYHSLPFLRGTIVATAHREGTLVVAGPQHLAWRDPDGIWTEDRLAAQAVGYVSVLEADDEGVWVGGERGFGFYRFATRDFRAFNAAGDLPGPVRDLAATKRFVWVGTDRGLVRFSRSALSP